MTKKKKTTLSLDDLQYLEERFNARKTLAAFKEWWLGIRATESEWLSDDALGLLNNITLQEHPKNMGAIKQLARLKSSLAKRKTSDVLQTIEKCQDNLRPTSNENPFEINDRVAIVRSEHGWHDGYIDGVVRTRNGSVKGGFSYNVEVNDDGHEYTVLLGNTRDAYKIG